MKTCKWNFKVILTGILAIAAVAFFFSCEIGLGGAVDTQPPSVTITNPPVDSVIRDNFALSGTYDDDGTIASVSATLSRPDGKGQKISITSYTLTADATEKGAGRWTLPVNALSETGSKIIADGTYQATVSVKDAAGRITTQSTTFTIDNTAPVIVLQRPSSSENSDANDIDSYGQKLTFEGMAADDNNIDTMEVYIYDSEGSSTEPIHTIILYNVPNSINTDVAIFEEGVENDYSKIFGRTDKQNITKKLYCKIKAYDGARKYPVSGEQTQEDKTLGNSTDIYYLYEDIASLVLDKHKITEVYQMFSGTYLLKDSSRSAQDVADVKQILSQKEIQKGQFSINPFNNPNFSILGRDPLKLDGTDFVSTDSTNELMNDSEMIIEVKTGLDAISINSTGLRVYLLPCNNNGEPLSTADSAKLYPVDSTYQKSGTSYKFTSKISKAGFVDKNNNVKKLDFGTTVIVGVEGADAKGNEITPDCRQYGFKFTSNGSAPELSIDTPSGYSNTCAKGADFTITGTTKAENGHATLSVYLHESSIQWKNLTLDSEKRPYRIEIDDGDDGTLYNGQGSENNGYNFSYTISKDEFDQDHTKTYIVEVEAEQGRITRESREVIYDVNPPEVRNYDITPVVTKEGDSNIYVNGTVKVTGSIYDTKSGVNNDLITCEVQKKNGSSWNKVGDVLQNTNTSDFEFDIDTTAVNDTTNSTSDMRLVIHAWDEAGNQGEFTYKYVVDQNTDKPVIESNDGSFTKNLTYAQLRANIQSIKNGNEDTQGSNLFLKGSSIAIKVSDDDGLLKKQEANGIITSGIKISAWANKKDGTDDFEVNNNITIAPVYAALSSNPASTIVTYTLPKDSGSYKIRIDALDKNYGTTDVLPTSSAYEEFYVQIRTDEPEVQISATPSYVTTNTASSLDPTLKKTAYSVSINIKAGTPPFKVTRKVGSTTTTVSENIANIGIVADTFTPTASGTGTITYYVYDDFGSSKETPFNYTLDNDKPTAIITSNAPTTQATENASVTFKGTASDTSSGSGIARIDVTFKASPDAADIHEASGTEDWSYVARFNELNLTEGTNKFYVRAVDNVGNIGAWVEQQFVYDTGSPVLSDISYSQDNGTTWTSTGTEFDASKKFSLKGTATDNNNLAKIEIYQKKDSDEEKLIQTITASGKSKAWQVDNLPRKPSDTSTYELKTGSYEYRVVVYDTCSTAKTSQKEFTAKIDLAAPTVTITSPSADDKLSGSSYTFEGTVTDSGTSGVAEYSYVITDSASAPASGWTTVPKTSGGSWNFAQKLGTGTSGTATDTKYEGEYYIYVKAKDKAGNETSGNNINQVHFYIDQTKPSVSFADSVKDYFTKGTLSLTGTASDTYGIKSVKVEYSDGTNTASFSSDVSGQGVTLSSSDDNKNVTWTKTLEFDPTATGKLRDGTYTFTITATDKAGRTETVSKTIVVDNVAPTFENVNFSSQTGKGLYYNSTEGVYYVSPSVGTKFTLSGIAKDNNGINEVECKVNGTAMPKVTSAGWSFDINTGTTDGTEKTVQVSVTDKAGNKTEYPEITVKVDTEAPNGIHKLDAKNKDIIFRIGNNDNDDIGPEDDLWNDNLDTDVGGKYSDGTYGNAETIKLRGFFDDASGSGVDLIYYKVFKTQPDSSNKLAQKFLKDGDKTYETQADGYFSLIAPPVEKRVFYTHTNGSTVVDWGGTNFDGKKYYIDDVKYNFLTTISGLSSGENYLVFVAVDKVGNAALESVEVAGVGTFEDYKINVDQVPPTVPNDKIYAPTLFFNTSNTEASNTFKVYGLANDTAAGIREAGVKINGTELFGVYNKTEKKTYLYDKEDTATRKLVGYLTLTTEGTANVTGATVFNGTALSNNTALWAVELNKDAFAGITSGNSASVSLKVIDNAGAGNSETYPVANVMIDTAGPVVTIKSPTSGSTVNGNITVSVTASDGTGSGVAETAPVIYKKNGSNWTNLSLTPVKQQDGSWNFTVNTRDFTDNANTIIRVSFNDVLGNTGYSTDHTLAVNQDTDRPIIKMNQVKQDGSGYLTSKTVFGSVIDDDGTINKLWVWSKKLNSNAEPTAAPSTSDNGQTWTVPEGWIEFGKADTNSTLENNNWQIDSSESDGDTTWFWAVADADNSVFWTKAGVTESQTTGTPLSQPYITYSDATKQPNTTGISFKYDTESPEINSVELLRLATNVYKTGTTRYKASEIADYVTDLASSGVEWSSANNIVFGKDYALMYVKVEVTEKTAMNSTTPVALDYITLGTNDIYVTGPVKNKYTYYLGPFDLSAKTTETKTLNFTVRDDANKTGSKEKAIVVDNSATITISDVSPAVDEIASGKFTFRGQVSDAESSVSKVEYYIPKDTETSVEGKNFIHITTATSIQWSIDFNNFNDTVLGYTTNGTQVSVSTDFDGYDIGDNIYRVPVWFKVTDSVGNIGYVTDNAITYDPNEDRPKVYITDPEIKAETEELEEKGGRIKISGNAQDNEGILAVYLQFKVDNGEWTGGSTVIPGTESNPIYGYQANNTKNWNYTYDAADISDGSVLSVRAIAVDSDTGLLSAWSETLQISINNELPFLDGDMYLRQYDGNTVKVEKIYEPNMYIKGEWKLEGNISTTSSDYLQKMIITINDDNSRKATWTRTGSQAGTLAANGTGIKIAFADDDNDQSLSFSIPVSGSSEWKAEIVTTDKAEHDGTETPQINIDNTAPSFADYTDKPTNKIVLYQDSYGAGGTQLGSDHFVQNSNGAQFTLAGKIVEEQSGFDKAVFYFKRTGSDEVKRVYNPMEVHGTDNLNNRANIASNKANAVAGTGGTIYINDDELPVRPLTVTRSSTESATNNEIKNNMNIRAGGLVYIGGLYRLITEVNRTTGTIKFEPVTAVTNTDAEFVYGLVVDHNGERDNGAGGVDYDDGDELLESYSGSQTANYRWEATFNSANIPDGPIDIYVVTFDKAGNIGYGYLGTKASNNAPRITKVMFGTDLNGNTVYDFDTDEFSTFYAFKDEYDKGTTKKGNAIWTLDTSAELASGKYWTAKNGIAVIPEFVGGAGPFYYVFNKGVVTAGTELSDHITTTPAGFTYANNGTNPVLLASGANAKIKTGGKNGSNATWTYGTSTSGSNTGGSLSLDNTTLVTTTGEYSKAQNGTETNPAVVYSFTFWDSTEESTPGTDTGSTILNAYVRQDLTDDVVPNSVIKPFEWNGTGYSKTVSTVTNGGQPAVTAVNLDALADTDILGTVVTGSGTTTVTTTTITPNNNLYGASKANGHIELEKDLTDAVKAVTVGTGNNATTLGDDPKVSGKITFHGTSYDNTRLSSIWFKFTDFTASNGRTGGDSEPSGTTGYTQAAYYDVNTAAWLLAPATMTDNNWEFTVTDTYFNQTGHKVDWYLSIDTSAISNTAGIDKTLTVITLDSAAKVSSTTASAQSDEDAVYNKPTYKMDVVPYITKLYTGISDSAGEEFARSATGKYIVRGKYRTKQNGSWTNNATETVKLFGFNLEADSTNGNLTIGTTDKIKTTAVAESTSNGITTPAHLTFPVGTNTSSGKLSIMINGVESLNNINASPVFEVGATQATEGSSAMYNSQANGKTNDRLTDDVDLWIWDMNYFLNETNITSPMLKMDKAGLYYMSYGRGIQNMYVNVNGTGTSVDFSYNKFHNTNVAFDDNGSVFAVAMNTDRIHNDSSRFVLYTPSTANGKVPTTVNSGTTSYVTSSNSKRHLELAYNQTNSQLYNINRVKDSKITTAYKSGTTYIGLSYYDANNTINPVKFRYGTRSGAAISGGITGQIGNGVSSSSSTPSITMTQSNDPTKTDSSALGYHIVASDNTTFKGGQYTAVGLIPNGDSYVGVIAWYDADARRVCYSYNTAPGTATAATDNQWQKHAVYLDEQYTGWHVDLTVDANNGIHIAYYNSAKGDLKYVYLPSYNYLKDSDGNDTGNSVTPVTVDSYLSVGTNITINTRLQDGNYVPYIYYYNASSNQTPNSIKVAWRKDFTALRDGAIDDKFTGAWESMTIPTVNIPVDATVCGGVPSTADGNDAYKNTTVFLGYMSDQFYEKAYIKGDITTE